MSLAAEVRAARRRHEVRLKKSWGQHFLIDEQVLQRVARAVGAAPDDWVVEVGAGLGVLTRPLLEQVSQGRVIALERDPALYEALAEELDNHPRLERWLGDAVRFDLEATARQAGQRLIVAGNLPYQISGPVLGMLLRHWRSVKRAVLMVQWEVAARLVAAPGTRAYGVLSVLLGLHYDVSLVCRVGRRAFSPPPRVESAVVGLERRDTPRVTVAHEGLLDRVVRASFAGRRKMLRNALRAIAPPPAVEDALAAVALDGRRRGETLSLAEFAMLSEALNRLGGSPGA